MDLMLLASCDMFVGGFASQVPNLLLALLLLYWYKSTNNDAASPRKYPYDACTPSAVESCGPIYYSFYWYKSTNTDAASPFSCRGWCVVASGRASARVPLASPVPKVQILAAVAAGAVADGSAERACAALLVQKYKY